MSQTKPHLVQIAKSTVRVAGGGSLQITLSRYLVDRQGIERGDFVCVYEDPNSRTLILQFEKGNGRDDPDETEH